MNFLLSKRRFHVILKILIIIIVCGLYFIILIKESMAAIESGKLKVQKKATAAVKNEKTHYALHKFHRLQKTSQEHQQQHQLDEPNQTKRRRRRTTTLATSVTITNQVPKLLQSTIKTPTAAILSKSIANQQSPRTHHKTNSSTINPIYEYSEEINAAAERDFNERRDHAADVCQRHKIINKFPPNAWEFFVSQGHGLAWCSVFKAASSTWLYYFNLLGGYSANYLQKTHTPPLELARKRFPRPNQYELNEVLAASISFLVVRDPFERLVSAYRNKLEGDRNKYYKLLGQQIVKKFRRRHRKGKASSGPTFREFIQFIVQHHKSGGRLDEHFSPIYTFCSVCSINFTLIAKMETFQRDTDYIIRQAGLDSLLLNKLPKKQRLRTIQNRANSDTKEATPRYFAELDEHLLDQLLKIYEIDFELFGYNSTKYYEYVQNSELDATGTTTISDYKIF